MAVNTHSLDLESGSSQFASVADTVPLSLTDVMSVFAWIRLESDTSANQTIVGKFYGATNNRSYIFTVTPTNMTFFNSSTGSNLGSCSVSTTLNTGTWYNVGFTKTSSTVKFYVNGAQVGTDQTAGFSTNYDSTASFSIGAYEVQGVAEAFLDGLIDEVVVTSDVVSAQEIAYLYAGWDATEKLDNIAGYWKLNNSYADSSGNGATLTASGSPSFSTTVPFANYAGLGGSFIFNLI